MPTAITADTARERLRPFLGRMSQPERLTRAEARAVLERAADPVLVLEGLWNYAKELMARGVERGTLLAAVTDLADLLEHCIKGFERVMSETQALGLGPDEV